MNYFAKNLKYQEDLLKQEFSETEKVQKWLFGI